MSNQFSSTVLHPDAWIYYVMLQHLVISTRRLLDALECQDWETAHLEHQTIQQLMEVLGDLYLGRSPDQVPHGSEQEIWPRTCDYYLVEPISTQPYAPNNAPYSFPIQFTGRLLMALAITIIGVVVTWLILLTTGIPVAASFIQTAWAILWRLTVITIAVFICTAVLESINPKT